MQGIGKLNPVFRQFQRRSYRTFVLGMHIPQTQKPDQRFPNCIVIKFVHTAEDPRGFQQHGFRDPDRPGSKHGTRGSGLLRIVANQQADDNISIDRCHNAASPRVQQQFASAPAISACLCT